MKNCQIRIKRKVVSERTKVGASRRRIERFFFPTKSVNAQWKEKSLNKAYNLAKGQKFGAKVIGKFTKRTILTVKIF